MSADEYTTIAVLLLVVVSLAREWVSPAESVLGGLVALVVLGVVEPAAAFVGFSSSATLTIAGLFVVARALELHGGLDALLGRVLGRRGEHRGTLVRLALPTAAVSSVMANTPLVAALAPVVRTWAERNARSPSRYLMPLSFAAILGGVVTTIGTSTTLVVSGLVEQSLGEGFSFLEITPVGVPVAVAGVALLVVLAPRLLPDRRSVDVEVAAAERDYTFRMRVEAGGALDGVTVRDAGLRNLEDVFLARVERAGHGLAPVPPGEPLTGGDTLVFVGQVEALTGMGHRPGLTHAEQGQLSLLDGDEQGFFDVVIGRDSYLAGRSLKEASFRGRYGGAVIAIHRAGERVEGKLGEVRLQSGDALLVQSDEGFAERWRGTGEFAIVAPLDGSGRGASSRRPFVLAVAGAMVVVAALGAAPILTSVLGACAVLLATRTLEFHDALEALDLDVLLIVASAIGIGAAVESTGVAGRVADLITSVASAGGEVVALVAVIVGTLVLTELVTNVAAAALMVPIGLNVATGVGADPREFAIAVAVAASCSFLTPIGYQTNTIVYGLAGYRFGDYWRLGLPLTVTVTAIVVVVTTVV